MLTPDGAVLFSRASVQIAEFGNSYTCDPVWIAVGAASKGGASLQKLEESLILSFSIDTTPFWEWGVAIPLLHRLTAVDGHASNYF